ncbi:Hypp3204 [Branchiostoma lanceolatum]|uniref:Hypp3204 protein n=1 Tax=Branchiostoma lanceolatum TaxID=7740 RepID=A0A8K0ETB7_BRALA|nr:Hypp3204 [Branchiostoma lanceolatum]
MPVMRRTVVVPGQAPAAAIRATVHSTGPIVGIVIGCIAFIIFVITVCCCCCSACCESNRPSPTATVVPMQPVPVVAYPGQQYPQYPPGSEMAQYPPPGAQYPPQGQQEPAPPAMQYVPPGQQPPVYPVAQGDMAYPPTYPGQGGQPAK